MTLAHYLEAHLDYTIRKRYRYSPYHNGDQPYDPGYYERMAMSQDDPRTVPDHPEAWRVRGIQISLHMATNYDYLCRNGFYDQEIDQIDRLLADWYRMMAKRFPRFAYACQIEERRHQIKARLQKGITISGLPQPPQAFVDLDLGTGGTRHARGWTGPQDD